MEINQDLIINILIIIAAIALMKYMPRLLAFGIPFVDAADVGAKLERGEDVLVIDVRSVGEFASSTGHVPGALNLPLGDIRGRVGEVGEQLSDFKTHPVFLMCRTENRSTSAAKALRRAGLVNVAIIKGGIKGWTKAGLPIDGKA